MKLAGLKFPAQAQTPAERRLWLADSSPATIAQALEAMVCDLQAKALENASELAVLAKVPTAEVATSPFGLRAVAMGVREGAWCVPHELRDLLPNESVPETVQDPDHGVWDRGVLLTGKYQSFQHDDPLLTRNPNHMARWTGHEMLHRAGGFYWRPQIGRWELYLASRLNELVPVVHWYTTDSILRAENDAFDRELEGRERDLDLSSMVWMRAPIEALRPRIQECVPLLQQAVAHFDEELADIDREIATGQIVQRPRTIGQSATLDASSDAIAYVVGHIDRLRQRNVAAVLTHLPDLQPWVEDDVRAYRDRIERLFDELLFGEVEVDRAAAAERRAARQRWDLLLRAAHHPQTRHGRLRALIQELVRDDVTEREAVEAAIAARMDPEVAHFAACDGGVLNEASLMQLEDGLRSFAPTSVQRLQALGEFERFAANFVAGDSFLRRESLPERWEDFLRHFAGDEALVELVRFERALVEAPASDLGAQTLALDIDDDEITHDALLTLSSTLRRHRFARDIPGWYEELQENALVPAPQSCEPFTVLTSSWHDEVQVVPAPRGVLALLDLLAERTPMPVAQALEHLGQSELIIPQLQNEWPEDAEDWLTDLLAAGVVIARPSFGESPL